MGKPKYSSILCISDTHFPFQHPDTVAFLKELKSVYKPDKVVHIGDEIDLHSVSFHPHDPDLLSPSDELQSAIDRLKNLYRIFPEMDLVESNHGSLVYRKGKVHGLPRSVFKSYREVLGAPMGWRWHYDLTLMMSNNMPVYFHHARSSNILRASQELGMSCVFGHHHNQFCIQYWSSPLALNWGMFIGCLIDKKSLAFEYDNVNMKRPVIGTGVIVDGLPRLHPMVLDRHKRWVGKIV